MSIDEDALVRLKLREAKIQSLLRARFPGGWTPPPLSPVRGSARDFVVSDIRPQIDAARAELRAKSDEELDAMHTAANEQQHKREAIEASIDEKGRFFNWPDANADFDYWAKLEYWTFDEALLLLHGKSPDVVVWKDLEPFAQVSPFAKKFAATRKLAMRAELMNRGTGSVLPSAALDWAKQMDIDMPPALVAAVAARWGPFHRSGSGDVMWKGEEALKRLQALIQEPVAAVSRAVPAKQEFAPAPDAVAKRASMLARFRELGGKRPSEGSKKGTRGALAALARELGKDDKNLAQWLDKAIGEKRNADMWKQLNAKS
jgi:hypothetical protein